MKTNFIALLSDMRNSNNEILKEAIKCKDF